MSVCCSYQVAIFQVALITLVRCAFLRNHTTRFCTVILGIFVYCDSAILRSVRNLEQNAAGLGKAVADAFHELCVSNSANARVMLERLYLKSFDSLESG